MSVGTNLLELQAIDLDLVRERTELSQMPELKTLAQKRKTYAKLKDELLKLVGRRKDLETEVNELNEEEQACQQAVTDAQTGGVDPSDYRLVQELELELTDLAKQLDRIDHIRTERLKALADARDREAYAQEYIAKFENAVRDEALDARKKAEDIKARISEGEKKRAAVSARIPADTLAQYEADLKRFGGLAVEQLVGSVPSICRMALTESSLSDLSRKEGITRCPYCHRMLVLTEGE